jgi:hypothetical protein
VHQLPVMPSLFFSKPALDRWTCGNSRKILTSFRRKIRRLLTAFGTATRTEFRLGKLYLDELEATDITRKTSLYSHIDSGRYSGFTQLRLREFLVRTTIFKMEIGAFWVGVALTCPAPVPGEIVEGIPAGGSKSRRRQHSSPHLLRSPPCCSPLSWPCLGSCAGPLPCGPLSWPCDLGACCSRWAVPCCWGCCG